MTDFMIGIDNTCAVLEKATVILYYYFCNQ